MLFADRDNEQQHSYKKTNVGNYHEKSTNNEHLPM